MGYRSRKIKRTEGIVLDKFKRHQSRILKLRGILMVEIHETALNAMNISENPIHQVNEMTELREECATVKVEFALPRNFTLVAVVPIPIALYLYHVNLAQCAGADQILEPN